MADTRVISTANGKGDISIWLSFKVQLKAHSVELRKNYNDPFT